MTPLEKANEAMWDGINFSLEPGEGIDSVDARPVIRAFLEAAAEDERTCEMVFDGLDNEFRGYRQIGKAAILALKETINAG